MIFQKIPPASGTLSISPDEVIAAANKLLADTVTTAPADNMFIVKTANHWMQEAKSRPIQQMLFAEFWFDSELCILFADTNLGKSILAVQIGQSIASGKAIPGFPLQPGPQPVLYFDFELTDKQFETRYSVNKCAHFEFDDNFLRVEFNADVIPPDGQLYEDYLTDCLEQTLIEKQARVLIIDNLTYLKNETEKAKDALPLMKKLKMLKNKYDLSMLVLAHTPKRDLSKPITRNDLSGSKMLINFCDSAFAIGESSKDKTLRYLKQIKQRNTEQMYGADNILLCQIAKPKNFVRFEMTGFGTEREHLKEPSDKDNNETLQKAIKLKGDGLTVREIGQELGISHSTVSRMLNKA